MGAPACPGLRENPGSLPEDFHLEREVAAEARTGLFYMAKPQEEPLFLSGGLNQESRLFSCRALVGISVGVTWHMLPCNTCIQDFYIQKWNVCTVVPPPLWFLQKISQHQINFASTGQAAGLRCASLLAKTGVHLSYLPLQISQRALPATTKVEKTVYGCI